MNQHLKAAAFCAALVLSAAAWADDVAPAAAPEAKTEAVWVADFDKAVELAKKEKKDLLVDFTGSDWCGWCVKLHDEVFKFDEFVAGARKDYVLVSLDYPHGDEAKAKVPNAARNDELAAKYGVQSFPTILLMTTAGEVYGKTGYQPGGAAKYVEHVAALRAKGVPALKSAKEILAALASAKDGEKAAAYDRAIDALQALDEGAATAEMLAKPVKEAFDADAENKSGVRLRAAMALLKSGTAGAAVAEAGAKLDPKNEKGLLERAVNAKCATLNSLDDVKALVKSADELVAMGELKDKAVAKNLFITCAFLNYQHLHDAGKAVEYAKRAQTLGFEPDEGRAKAFIEQVIADEGKLPEQAKK